MLLKDGEGTYCQDFESIVRQLWQLCAGYDVYGVSFSQVSHRHLKEWM